ncbi:MAG: hypothetical protein IKZ47_00535 [Clostridia bacterium]|nr:hypothetical protein [Clostridia bacterium]
MKKSVSIIAVSVCICLILVAACFSVFRFGLKKATLAVSSVSGNAGDTVVLPVKITRNPGVTDIAFSLSYDTSKLTYKSFYPVILSGCDVFDHSSEGRITFASIDNGGIKDTGTLAYFTFAINEGADNGDIPVNIKSITFNDSDGDPVNVAVGSGKITVTSPCEGDGHYYLPDEMLVAPDCLNKGLQLKTCENCGHSALSTVAPTGHDFESRFTADVPAQNGEPGMISMHCKTCGTKTNIIIYDDGKNLAIDMNNSLNLSVDTLSRYAYFVNGGKSYPDVSDEDMTVKQILNPNRPAINDDGSVNIDVATDDVLTRFFGEDKKGGIYGSVKRAAIAEEIPLKLLFRLLSVLH